MTDRDDDWSMIDERVPPLTKLCDPATQIEISYHDRNDDDWSTIDILHIGGLSIWQFMIIWWYDISRDIDDYIWFVDIWPRVHEQKSRSSLINRSMGWDKIDILLWSYHWQTWLKTDKLDSDPTTVDGWRLDRHLIFIWIKYVAIGQIIERVFQKVKIILKTCLENLSAGHTGV